MQLLFINCYQNNKTGNELFSSFQSIVLRTLIKCYNNVGIDMNKNNIQYLSRYIDELDEFVCDWNHDILNEKSSDSCKLFDRIDLVFIIGDMKIVPWHPIATQLITLINMCNHTNKSIFSIGTGAYACIYATATVGTRFHILNGPIGDSLEALPSQYTYGSGSMTSAYPSAWLDNELGDLYV